MDAVVLHLDMDAFYAAVEVREDPALRGKPVIVGHPGRRGVVTTCSYEAREYGVHSAMPSAVAIRKCPDAIWVAGRMKLYQEVSAKIFTLLGEYSPTVEPLSIDEAFVDLTGIAADLAAGGAIADEIADRILAAERLTASYGVAPNKFLAKVASDLEKPAGRVVLPMEAVPKTLWPMPIRRLWGVGPRLAEKLAAIGVHRIGDLLEVAPLALDGHVGARAAERLRTLARGEDGRRVESRRVSKSVSEERTYGVDLTDAADLDRELLARAEGVGRRLRAAGHVARTVHIKVRDPRFRTWTRAKTLPEPTDLAEVLVAAARELFRERIRLDDSGVRLLGVGVSGIEAAGAGQGSLFEDEAILRARKAARASDAVRRKLGRDALTRARLLPRDDS